MELDLMKLRMLLFENPTIKSKIIKDYGFAKEPRDVNEFSTLLLSSLNQPVKDIMRNISNTELFESMKNTSLFVLQAFSLTHLQNGKVKSI